MNPNKQVFLADFALFCVAAIWGGGFLAATFALQSFPPFLILTFRFLGAAVCMFPFFYQKLLQTEKTAIKKALFLGIIQFVGLSLQLIGLHHTTPGKQAFLVASYVAFVPFFSWIILKKRPQIKSFVTGIITLVGLGLLSLQETFWIGIGDSLSILFAVVFAIQIVMTGIFAKNIHPVSLSFFQFLSAGVLSGMTSLMTESVPAEVGMCSVGGIFYLIIANTVVAFTVQNIAQKYTTDTHTALILSLESVFGFFFSALLWGEKISGRGKFGCVLIFGAVLLSKWKMPAFWHKQKENTLSQ